jgi:hypothetical protein
VNDLEPGSNKKNEKARGVHASHPAYNFSHLLFCSRVLLSTIMILIFLLSSELQRTSLKERQLLG